MAEDFGALIAAYENRTIHLLETGYPTGPVLNSSEAKQAQFIREVFKAWDSYADQIRVVSFTGLTDLSRTAVEDLEDYYGIFAQNFAELLRTLGLRTYAGSGTDQQGFQMLIEESQARGWYRGFNYVTPTGFEAPGHSRQLATRETQFMLPASFDRMELF